jgi:hypothetical protein
MILGRIMTIVLDLCRSIRGGKKRRGTCPNTRPLCVGDEKEDEDEDVMELI